MNTSPNHSTQSKIASESNKQPLNQEVLNNLTNEDLIEKINKLTQDIEAHKVLLLSLSGMVHGLIRSSTIDRVNVLSFIQSTSYSESHDIIKQAENHARIIMSDASTRNRSNADDAEYIVEFSDE